MSLRPLRPENSRIRANGWTQAEEATLRLLWGDPATSAETIAAELPGRSRNAIIGKAHALGLADKPKKPPRFVPEHLRAPTNDHARTRANGVTIRKAYASRGDDCTLSRFVKEGTPHLPRQAELLQTERVVSPRLLARPEVVAGQSRFHAKGVFHPVVLPHVLVSGHNNAKIGRDVRKGWARGYFIYTLTLEERATCPRACHHWATCYGNNMPFAARVDHTDQVALKLAIERDVQRLLAMRGRVGVMVRLHALGDFFDARYVAFWSGLLDRYPQLAAFGYTAWPPDSPIGAAIVEAKARHGRRFAIRWSNGTGDTDCAVPVRAVDEPVNATVCPEQTGRTAACATCGLCWNSTRNIAFVEH